jgi:hypothetical protein
MDGSEQVVLDRLQSNSLPFFTMRNLNKTISIIVFVLLLAISLTIGYPLLYLTDEWISADQLNHLVTGNDLLFGYSPYGAPDYAASHHDTLCYTLALPVVSLPAYHLFSLFGDDFRLAVVVLWSALLLALLLMIEFWFPSMHASGGSPGRGPGSSPGGYSSSSTRRSTGRSGSCGGCTPTT